MVIAAAAAVVAAVMLPVAALAAEQTRDGNLSVDIVDDRPSPTSSPTPTAGGPGQGGSGSGGGATGGASSPGRATSGGAGTGGVGTSDGGGTVVPASEVPPGEQVLFFVSGLEAKGRPSVNPFVGGGVTAQLTVENLTTEAIDATVEVHADDLFGNEVAKASTKTLGDLHPGDPRSVSIDLGEVRIAGLVHVYATITPLTDPLGVDLEPVARDAWTALPSWYAVGLLVATAIGLGVRAYQRYRRGL